MIWESELAGKNYWTNTFSLALQKKMLDQQNSSIFPRNIPGVTIQNMRREIDFKVLFCWYSFIVVMNLLNRDEPARHVLNHSGSKSHQAEASQTMDKPTTMKSCTTSWPNKNRGLSTKQWSTKWKVWKMITDNYLINKDAYTEFWTTKSRWWRC